MRRIESRSFKAAVVLTGVALLGPAISESNSEPVKTDAVLIGAGDIAWHKSNGDEQTAAIIKDVLASNKKATVFTVGDNAYQDGTTEDFNRSFAPSWGEFIDDITLPTVGNHEYSKSKTANGYFEYFGKAAGEKGKGYYAKDFGDWRAYVLNSELTADTEAGKDQLAWLKKDLKDHASQNKVAFEHRPLFSSGKGHGGDHEMKPFWDVLSQDKLVKLMINGHEHLVEIFAPQTPEGKKDEKNGIREVVIGTGGMRLYDFKEASEPNSEFQYNKTPAILQLDLKSDGTYKGEIVSPQKNIIYSFTN